MIKILIIDDEDIMRNCLCDVLTDDGYSVEVAREGIQGITLFENNPSDIVILDIKMPGLSGVEVLKIIKGNKNSTQVVMMTGYATVQTAVECMKLGAFDYLTKPFDMNQIREVIRQITLKYLNKTSSSSEKSMKESFPEQNLGSQPFLKKN